MSEYIHDVRLSKWKSQLLDNAATFFEPIDRQTNASQERIAQLEQLVGKMTLALDIIPPKKSLNLAGLNPAEKRGVVETLRSDYSVRQICDTLGFNRSSLYYQLKSDHSIFDCKWQWVNRLDNLDICRRNQVWVADVTFVRLKGHFVYVSVLMDVFTRMIRG